MAFEYIDLLWHRFISPIFSHAILLGFVTSHANSHKSRVYAKQRNSDSIHSLLGHMIGRQTPKTIPFQSSKMYSGLYERISYGLENISTLLTQEIRNDKKCEFFSKFKEIGGYRIVALISTCAYKWVCAYIQI